MIRLSKERAFGHRKGAQDVNVYGRLRSPWIFLEAVSFALGNLTMWL